MDVAEFDGWLSGIAALTPPQRRQAWQTLALSEASDCDDIETGPPWGVDIASSGAAAAPDQPPTFPPSPVARPLNRLGTDVVAELGQRRVDSIGCPHCDSLDVVHWGKASALPRYRCKGCQRTFNALTKTPLAGLRMKDKWPAQAEAMIDGVSIAKAAEGAQERRQIGQARDFRRTDSCSRGTRPSWCDHGCGAGKTEPRVDYSGAWRYRHGSQRILLRRWHRDRCLRPQGWHPNPHPANARQAQPASTRFPHQQRQCLPQPPQGMAASLPWRRDEEPAQLPWLAPYSGGLGPKDHARGFYLWSDRIRPISTINAIRAKAFVCAEFNKL